jgi:hypothetical protein
MSSRLPVIVALAMFATAAHESDAAPIPVVATGVITTSTVPAIAAVGSTWSISFTFDPATLTDSNPGDTNRGRYVGPGGNNGLAAITLQIGGVTLTDASFQAGNRIVSVVNDGPNQGGGTFDAVSFNGVRNVAPSDSFGLGTSWLTPPGPSSFITSDALPQTAAEYVALFSQGTRAFTYNTLVDSRVVQIVGSVTSFSFGGIAGPPPASVPEPGTLALLGVGLGLAATACRRRRIR